MEVDLNAGTYWLTPPATFECSGSAAPGKVKLRVLVNNQDPETNEVEDLWNREEPCSFVQEQESLAWQFPMSTITPNALQSGVPPVIPLPFNANQPSRVRLYPLSNYTFGVKETQPEEDPSVIARLKRLEEHYVEHGMRRTCEGILVCHEHNHPHILMLQIANAFFKLPGDYLKPEDDEIEGFKARLDERLAPVGRIGEGEEPADWEIGECLAQWWRPNFETFMYPFIPAHITRPKECKKNYFIQLPKNSKFLALAQVKQTQAIC